MTMVREYGFGLKTLRYVATARMCSKLTCTVKADYLSAVANMQRAIRVSRNDVLRVVHPASYMLRPLRVSV